MSRKPGTHLSQIGKENAHLPGFGDDFVGSSGELSEQFVILRNEDIHAEAPEAPFLDWSTIVNGEIAIQMKDLEGFAEGNVTIKASSLQKIHPRLLPGLLEGDFLFQISLISVVMQVQAHLRRSSDDGPAGIGSDFDTPISQVAREDEGCFKLEELEGRKEPDSEKATHAEQKSLEPVLTPADRPLSGATRKLSGAERREQRPSMTPHSALNISDSISASDPKLRPAETRQARENPRAKSARENAGQERLRVIFMTEDYLDLHEVAQRIAALPRITNALVISAEGTVLGGTLPEGHSLGAAILAPAFMRQVREFERNLRGSETSAFTLLGEKSVSLFAEGDIHILIWHEGRGLVPGMRKRISEIAAALDLICPR
jgi:hypothetical protein